MKIKLASLAILLQITAHLFAQTPDALVDLGRQALVARDINTAHARFGQALAASPAHETANFFYAATRLLILANQPSGSNFLTRIGFSDAGRDIYQWTAKPSRDAERVPQAPTGLNASELTAQLRTNIIPALASSSANFAKITHTNFLISLSEDETTSFRVSVDYGDVLLLRAILHQIEYMSYTLHAQNVDAPLSTIQALHTNELLSIERMLDDYPLLCTFASTNDLAAGRTAFVNAVDRYCDASEFIRRVRSPFLNDSTPFFKRLFNLDPENYWPESNFRSVLTDIKNSLNGRLVLSASPRYEVHAANLFNGVNSWRSFAPAFRSNYMVLGTFPDQTFGGMFRGLDEGELEQDLAKKFKVIPSLDRSGGGILHSPVGDVFYQPIHAGVGHQYMVQSSTNLSNWQNLVGIIPASLLTFFVDGSVGGHGSAYYRLVENPVGQLPPPPNDNFNNRYSLPGVGIKIPGYFAGATTEPGEPNNSLSRTVWHSWQAPVTGTVIVTARNEHEGFYGGVSVYTGNTLQSLVPVMNQESWNSFEVVAGTTYQIQVGQNAWQNFQGGFELIITLPPSLNAQVTGVSRGQILTPPASFSVLAVASSSSSMIKDITVYLDRMNDGEGQSRRYVHGSALSAIWTNIGPGAYSLDIVAEDSLNISTNYTLNFIVAATNDFFVDRVLLTGPAVRANGFNGGATMEPGEPDHAMAGGGNSVWWTWTAPTSGDADLSVEFDPDYCVPMVAVYTGNSVSSLNEVSASISYGNEVWLRFTAVAGQKYAIAVDELSGMMGDITLELSMPPMVSLIAPTNNASFTAPSNITLEATASDPSGIGCVEFSDMGESLGFVTVPPYSLTLTNATPGYHYFDVRAVNNLGVVGYGTNQADVMVEASVAQYNDNFAYRLPISGSSATLEAANIGGTKEPGEPNHAGIIGGASVWWTWTAPVTGLVTIDTKGSSFDTVLGAYTGSSVSALSLVASNDDSGGVTSQVTFLATAGVAYQIAVDGYRDSGGPAAGTGTVVLHLKQ